MAEIRKCEDPFHMRPLWNGILDIYRDYAALCEKHNLRFYITAGSLLGAVRHGGFIPWDDDFDILMPRPDYEKFLKLSEEHLPPHLKVVTRKNTPEFDLTFAKVHDIRKEHVLGIESKVGFQLSNGLFIDVYPMDGCPQTRFGRTLNRLVEMVHYSAYRFSIRKQRGSEMTIAGKINVAIGAVFSIFIRPLKNAIQFADWSDEYVQRIPYDSTRWTGTAGCLVGRFQRILPPNVWGEPRQIEFEGIIMPAPAKTGLMLENFYGDYMKLPPPELRRPSHEYSHRCPWWLGPTKGRS